MEELPAQLLPAVPHITLGVFSFSIPNLIFLSAVIIIFFLAAWARLPKSFKPDA